MTEAEGQEISEFWNTLDGSSCFYEAVTRMAKDEHYEAEERKKKEMQMMRKTSGKAPELA
jgi:hypothetical protein